MMFSGRSPGCERSKAPIEPLSSKIIEGSAYNLTKVDKFSEMIILDDSLQALKDRFNSHRQSPRFLGSLLRIIRKLFEPDNADTDIGIRKFINNRRLHRPGALHTSTGSRRRKQG